MGDQKIKIGVGSIAPSFRLPATTGAEIGLQDYRGKSNVILFFVREYI